jgi:hypothetical protein
MVAAPHHRCGAPRGEVKTSWGVGKLVIAGENAGIRSWRYRTTEEEHKFLVCSLN